MELLPISFVAGALTVLAPCILPILPVILVRSSASAEDARPAWLHPVVVVGSLAVSVIIFSLLLKASTALLGVPQEIWQYISGGIVVAFGLILLFPEVWARVTAHIPVFQKASELAGTGYKKKSLAGSALIGLALGPIFNSCSPTYALIVASILPVTFGEGFTYLVAYTLGLTVVLLAIAFAGQRITKALGWLANPKGWFHKTMAVVFIVVGLMIVTGFDKKFQAFVLEQGWYDPLSHLEESLRK
ncbi:MAG TPA: cytochrome c biogenesis protein CcdA [Candidatus Saccharimonadales bacterium]|nr:cytochrome c biogenesis protein CcdA [Candidatus Saccharimonadales bacterium]